jgi:hypothetical protein
VCWILLQVGVFLACLAWGWRRFGTLAVAFGCMSMPAALGIAHGQDCAMFLGVLIASYALAEKGLEFASGAVLGLLLVKFNLTPLWFIALLMQRRWRALAGFAATGTAVAGISLAMVGLDGVRAYAAMLLNRDFAWLAAGPDFMISFQGLAYNLGIASPWAQAAMVAAIFAVFLAAVWQAPLWRIYTATTAASLLVAPHVLGYDAAMLLLGLWLVIFRDSLRPTRIVALWLFMPFPFSFTLVGKPWVAISSLSLLALVMALAGEGVSARRAARLNVPGPPNP